MPDDPPWQVIVPVKSRPQAKSRLHPPPGVLRSELAYAMVCDTLRAAADTVGASAVWVVSRDPAVQRFALVAGSRTVDDPNRGLNAAIESGLAAAASESSAVAVLLGDLPALRATELDTALLRGADHAVTAVADRHGEGTTLLTARGVPLVPQFGPGSAHRHRDQLGAVLVPDGLPGLRCDVDERADLEVARALGLGVQTTALLAGSSGAAAPGLRF